MSNIKKYLQFLCIIIVCLNSTFIISSEYYIPVPDTSAFDSPEMVESGTSLFKNISEFMKETIKNDPRFVAVPLIAAVGGLLYMERTNISTYAQKQCDILEQETKDYLERGINTNTPSFFLGKTMRMYLLRPLFIGIPTYLSYNKFYIAAAFICCIGGRFFGFPVPGGLLAGTSLAAGWLQQGHAVTHQRLDEVQAAIEKSRQENEALHAKAEKKLNVIERKIEALSDQITADIKQVETTMSRKIEQVGDQVRGVDEKVAAVGSALTMQVEEIGKKVDLLNGIPGQILSLLGEVSTVKTQNVESVTRTNALFEKLQHASEGFVATKEAIEKQVTELVKKTVESNQKIETTQSAQAGQIDKLLQCAAEQGNSLRDLQSFLETMQQEQNKHAATITERFDALAHQDEINRQELTLLNTFKLSTSSGITKLTEDLSVLSLAQRNMQESLDRFFSDVESRFVAINSKVEANQEEIKNKMESNQTIILQQMSKNREDLEGENKKLRRKIKKMKDQQQETTTALLRLENTIQRLGSKIVDGNAELKNLTEDTNSMVRSFAGNTSLAAIDLDTHQQEQKIFDHLLLPKRHSQSFGIRNGQSQPGFLAILNKSRPGSKQIIDTNL